MENKEREPEHHHKHLSGVSKLGMLLGAFGGLMSGLLISNYIQSAPHRIYSERIGTNDYILMQTITEKTNYFKREGNDYIFDEKLSCR